MNREQTKEILKAIQGYYQNFNPTDMAATLELWTMTLEEYSYQDVSMALLSYFKTDDKGFAPVPGQLISLIQKTNSPVPMSETEAFGKIMKAIERSAWHSEEEFAKLDPILQKIVGDPQQLMDWSGMTVTDIECRVQPMITRDYRAEVQRQQEYAKLPEDVRARIDAVNNRPRLYEGRMITDESKTGTD